MQETYGHSLGGAGSHLPGDRFRMNGIQWSVNLAGSQQPFLNFEREMSWDQGFRTLEPDIVSIRPIASTNLIYVPGAPGDDKRGTRAFAFQDNIDRDSRSMHEG